MFDCFKVNKPNAEIPLPLDLASMRSSRQFCHWLGTEWVNVCVCVRLFQHWDGPNSPGSRKRCINVDEFTYWLGRFETLVYHDGDCGV